MRAIKKAKAFEDDPLFVEPTAWGIRCYIFLKHLAPPICCWPRTFRNDTRV